MSYDKYTPSTQDLSLKKMARYANHHVDNGTSSGENVSAEKVAELLTASYTNPNTSCYGVRYNDRPISGGRGYDAVNYGLECGHSFIIETTGTNAQKGTWADSGYGGGSPLRSGSLRILNIYNYAPKLFWIYESQISGIGSTKTTHEVIQGFKNTPNLAFPPDYEADFLDLEGMSTLSQNLQRKIWSTESLGGGVNSFGYNLQYQNEFSGSPEGFGNIAGGEIFSDYLGDHCNLEVEILLNPNEDLVGGSAPNYCSNAYYVLSMQLGWSSDQGNLAGTRWGYDSVHNEFVTVQNRVLNISGYVGGFYITDCGSGYDSAPSVTITAAPNGGGSGATATATISDGVIQLIGVSSGGSGYTYATVTITESGASGALATAVVSGGQVTQILIIKGGSGYSASATVTISGDGSGATAGTVIVVNGGVSSITITNVGSGYRRCPSVSFSGGTPEGGASADARLGASGILMDFVNNPSGYHKAIYDGNEFEDRMIPRQTLSGSKHVNKQVLTFILTMNLIKDTNTIDVIDRLC